MRAQFSPAGRSHAHRRRAARRGTPPVALTVQSGLLKGLTVILSQQQIKLLTDASKLRQQVFGFNVAPAARGEVRPAAFEKVTVRGDDAAAAAALDELELAYPLGPEFDVGTHLDANDVVAQLLGGACRKKRSIVSHDHRMKRPCMRSTSSATYSATTSCHVAADLPSSSARSA